MRQIGILEGEVKGMHLSSEGHEKSLRGHRMGSGGRNSREREGKGRTGRRNEGWEWCRTSSLVHSMGVLSHCGRPSDVAAQERIHPVLSIVVSVPCVLRAGAVFPCDWACSTMAQPPSRHGPTLVSFSPFNGAASESRPKKSTTTPHYFVKLSEF